MMNFLGFLPLCFFPVIVWVLRLLLGLHIVLSLSSSLLVHMCLSVPYCVLCLSPGLCLVLVLLVFFLWLCFPLKTIVVCLDLGPLHSPQPGQTRGGNQVCLHSLILEWLMKQLNERGCARAAFIQVGVQSEVKWLKEKFLQVNEHTFSRCFGLTDSYRAENVESHFCSTAGFSKLCLVPFVNFGAQPYVNVVCLQTKHVCFNISPLYVPNGAACAC